MRKQLWRKNEEKSRKWAWKHSQSTIQRMISDCVELWDTDAWFSHVQTMVDKCSASQDTQDSTHSWSRVMNTASKVWVLKLPSRQCWAVLATWQHCLNSVVSFFSRKKRVFRRSRPLAFYRGASGKWRVQRLSEFMCVKNVWNQFCQSPIACLSPLCDCSFKLTDHRMSGLPFRVKYKYFQTICEKICDNSPTESSSSRLLWWSSKQGLETL